MPTFLVSGVDFLIRQWGEAPKFYGILRLGFRTAFGNFLCSSHGLMSLSACLLEWLPCPLPTTVIKSLNLQGQHFSNLLGTPDRWQKLVPKPSPKFTASKLTKFTDSKMSNFTDSKWPKFTESKCPQIHWHKNAQFLCLNLDGGNSALVIGF